MRYFDRHRKRLTKHHYIRGTLKSVSGENEVKIEDSAGVPFNKIEIAGNTFQKTYNGYNPFHFKDFTGSKTDSDGNVLSWEMKNGIMTINGKSNIFTIVSINNTHVIDAPTFKAGTYTVTPYYYKEIGDVGMYGCDWRFSDPTSTNVYLFSGNSGVATKTFENDFKFVHAQIYIKSNVEFKDYKYAPAIFEGTYTSLDELPPYEPYVGGIPSPNPGQVISQNEIKKSQTDISASLNTEQYVLDQSGHMLIFKEPVIMDLIDPSLPVRFSIKNFHTGNADDMIFLAMNYDQFLLGSTCDLLASGDGTLYEFEFPGEAYPDGVYVGLGNMATPMSQEDVYVSLAVEAGITATQTTVIEKPPLVIPAYPQEIVNANNEGMRITLHGDNFLNKQEFSLEGLRNETAFSNHASIVFPYTKLNLILKPNTKYRFSCEIEGVTGMPDGATFKVGQGFLIMNSAQTTVWGTRTSRILNNGEIFEQKFAFTTPSNFYEQKYEIRVYTGYYSLDGSKVASCIFRNVQITKDTGAYLHYQPYFNQEISIPPSVEVDGATVDLNMASISITSTTNITYTKTDYLTVDRLSNKVLYHQNIGKKTLNSSNMLWHIYTSGKGIILFFSRTDIGAAKNYNPIVTNKYLGYTGVHIASKHDYGITTDSVWWSGAWKCAITIHDIRFDNLEDFLADLDQNPLEIEYGLAEEITHDITSTELGQALLRLCVERGLDGTLRVESELGISSISCDYYSQESEDKVVLTVSYQNEAGEALMDDKTHNVRRGSKYQIVSPQIDGYEPTEKDAFGVADGDLTIILKYKEVSDATV